MTNDKPAIYNCWRVFLYGGRFYAGQLGDAEGFSQMTSGGFEVYNADYDVKLRFGYTTDDDDYPFIQHGSGSGALADDGLVKKFSDAAIAKYR